jgi:hypothetical protein
MLHPYTARPSDVRECLSLMSSDNSSLFFVGDSIARRLFLATKVALGDALEADFEKTDETLRDTRLRLWSHGDLSHTTSDGLTIAFRWDPFLNATSYQDRRVFPIVSAGFWHLQHFGEDPPTAFDAFQKAVNALLDQWNNTLANGYEGSNPLLLRLVSPVVHAKLSPDRQENLNEQALKDYNQFIREFAASYSQKHYPVSPSSLPLVSEALHAVFTNHPDLAPKTEDGLHYDFSVTSKELNVLLNGICNKKLFSQPKYKGKVTACCHSGPKLKTKNYSFLGFLILYAAFCLLWRYLNSGIYVLSCAHTMSR